MSRFDPLTADAEQIRAAVVLPDVIRVKPGGVVLALSVEREKLSEKIEELFALEPVTDSATYASLKSENEPGFHIEIFRIARQDLERLASFRQQVTTWKQQDPGNTPGSLSINIAACRIGDSVPSGELLVSTYLRTEAEDDFFPLAYDVDLRSVEAQAEQKQYPDSLAEEWLSQCPVSS